ncbi:MAG: ABC transporter substrate-binding protein [Gammaproteobacteria bacterium]
MHAIKRGIMGFAASLLLSSCGEAPLNSPYPDSDSRQSVLYTSFTERPKHLDPAVSYSANEYVLIGQIYEPPFQYHYLNRPYQLVPLAAGNMPEIVYFNARGQRLGDNAAPGRIAYTDYIIDVRPGIYYQPHPALARDARSHYRYHHLNKEQLGEIETLADFPETGTRELTAEDYVYQIKRMVHPDIHSPVGELMKEHIVGLADFSDRVGVDKDQFRSLPVSGVVAESRYRYRIRVKGKYPQFIYWLAMPFFAPMPWEADLFYSQPGLADKNISLDWYPLGTGPYMLEENNPNRRMTLVKNPNFHDEFYPVEGEGGDGKKGLLTDAGKKLPFIDKVVFMLEKETIPYWSKFLQGYYDASAIASDSFDQAVQFTGQGLAELTPMMKDKGIKLQTTVTTSIYYMGFNMLDSVIGGMSEKARRLRQAIAIAVDYEEYISIFMNGRGVPAQGMLPPGIFGYAERREGMNRYVYDWTNGDTVRKSLQEARKLMRQAGYPDGRDPKTGEPLILYLDTAAGGPDDRARLNWYRKQFSSIGIQLVIRATDYNRFQQKMLSGNAQIFMWGWNADYPDPENFFFLLYGPNGKVKYGGENAVNYRNPRFDRLFEQMRNMDNGPARFRLIQRLQEIVRHDAPWVFGFHPKDFALYHSWFGNLKPNLMANNGLKYTKIDAELRRAKQKQWNKPILWPLGMMLAAVVLLLLPGIKLYRRRAGETIQ